MPSLATTVVEVAPLSVAERTELEDLERTLRDCEDAAQRYLIALATIREKRLYREKADTWEEYCRKELGISRDYGSKKAAAGRVILGLIAGGFSEDRLPNESQARPLVSMSAEQQREAWAETLEQTEGNPTSTVVAEVAQRIKQPVTKNAVVEVISAAAEAQKPYQGKQGTITDKKPNGVLMVEFEGEGKPLPFLPGQVALIKEGVAPTPKPEKKHRPHKALLRQCLNYRRSNEEWSAKFESEVEAACS